MTKTLVAGQSDALTEFYRAYLAWVESGAHEDIPPTSFVRGAGLCCNLRIHVDKNMDTYLSLHREMTQQFEAAGLDNELPFNTGDDSFSYSDETIDDLCHTNPHRLQWVRDHV